MQTHSIFIVESHLDKKRVDQGPFIISIATFIEQIQIGVKHCIGIDQSELNECLFVVSNCCLKLQSSESRQTLLLHISVHPSKWCTGNDSLHPNAANIDRTVDNQFESEETECNEEAEECDNK